MEIDPSADQRQQHLHRLDERYHIQREVAEHDVLALFEELAKYGRLRSRTAVRFNASTQDLLGLGRHLARHPHKITTATAR